MRGGHTYAGDLVFENVESRKAVHMKGKAKIEGGISARIDEIDNVIQEVVCDFARQINLEMDSDVVQEKLDSNNQELTMSSCIAHSNA
ncbi:hypothetical protein TNCV_2643371 [Trichonephila clavipes]|nr:hypothetical protein TNCV_2643371 [Trichonephila clavipes]